jgi:predicted alpha/beta hydrolase family esterase
MKIVGFHGTDSSGQGGWWPYFASELKKIGHEVWVPDLPGADKPNLAHYNKYLDSQDWDFTDNLIVGHSSGAVTILGFLQQKDTKVDTAILVSPFTDEIMKDPHWSHRMGGMFEQPFDFEKIKTKAKKFIIVHSDNDPYCPLEGAKEIAEKLDAELIIIPGGQHFSSHLDPAYKKFPKLIEIIKQKVTV